MPVAVSPSVERLSRHHIAAGIAPRLRTVVESRPHAVALLDGTTSLTFAELAGRAGAVSDAVQGHCDGVSDGSQRPIAMLARHDAPAVATLVGLLLSGHPVLVMDATAPTARLATQLRHLDATLLVTDEANRGVAQDLAAATSTRLLMSPADQPTPETDWARSSAWNRDVDPGQVAALGFTSGSTGVAKVVALDQRHLVGDAWVAASVDDCVGPNDVMAHTLPLAFAAGLNVTLAGLLSGARTAMYDTRTRTIAELTPWARENGVTVLHSSPAILRALVRCDPDPADLVGLRVLTLSGEAVHRSDILAARRVMPPTCTFIHKFGSTETGLVAQLVIAPDGTPDDASETSRLSVGSPSGLTRVRLVDSTRTPVRAGETGIVEVTRTEYLATGYWRDQERTDAAFTDNADGSRSFLTNDLARLDEHGRLWLLGRRDHSVKVRGYLVEPAEVDAALHDLPDVVEAVTVGRARPDGQGNRLVAYVVSGAERPAAASIRAALRERLPAYMIPEAVVFLDALPRTERGKLDRAALPPPPPPVGSEPPRTEWEQVVAQVWTRALELDDVARDADFFELGGDSLAAEAVVSMMVSDLGIPPGQVTAATLVEAPTVAAFAGRARRRPRRSEQTLTVLRPAGTGTPLFLIAGGGGLGVSFVPIARHLPDDRPVYALHAYALERPGIPDWSVRAIARRHTATLRRLQPHGPYLLGGHSFGGVVAFEMAQQLQRAGQEVALLAIIDSFPPDPALLPSLPAASLMRRVRDAVGLAVTGLVPTPGIGQYWRFHRQSQWLSQHYRGRPYSGGAVVIVANSPEREARSQWAAAFSGAWKLLEVAGDHQSILRDPHAATIAAALSAAVAEASQVSASATR